MHYQQQHQLDYGPQRSYYIESLAAGKVLDINQDPINKGQLIIYDNHKGTNQQFAIVHEHL